MGSIQQEEDMTGRCHAVLATGKRCPNAALPGSRYCGLPAHQALAEREAASDASRRTRRAGAGGGADASRPRSRGRGGRRARRGSRGG